MMAMIEEQAKTIQQQNARFQELEAKVEQQAEVIQILQKGVLSSDFFHMRN